MSIREIKVNRRQPSTVPVRIDRELYGEIQNVAIDQHRTVRGQIELLLHQALDAAAKLETREVRK